jgi:hypothetical protein
MLEASYLAFMTSLGSGIAHFLDDCTLSLAIDDIIGEASQ